MKSIKNYNKVYKNRRSFRMVLKLVLAALLSLVLVTIVLFFVLKHFTVYENGIARVMIPWLNDGYPYSENMAGVSAGLRIGKSAAEPSPNPFALPSRPLSSLPSGKIMSSPSTSALPDGSESPEESTSPPDDESPSEEPSPLEYGESPEDDTGSGDEDMPQTE